MKDITQQSGFAGFLALIGPESCVNNTSGGQGNDGHGAGDRKADAGLLGFLLRLLSLIFARVGHRESKPVNQFGVMVFPQPSFFGLLLDFVSDFAADVAQGGRGQFPPGSTIFAGVVAGRVDLLLLAIGRDLGDSGLAGNLLAITQDLPEERPKRDGGGVDGGDAEPVAVLFKDALDSLGREDIGKRQPGRGQKNARYFAKIRAALVVEICYRSHKKNPPRFCGS